jgi:hypothetical protein
MEPSMLTGIRLSNFKAFGEPETVPLGPVTLIYGPNSAGKSSVIQSILLLRQSLQGSIASDRQLLFSGDDTDLGSYRSALFQHNTNKSMALGYSFSSPRRTGQRRPPLPQSGVRALDFEMDLIEREGAGNSGEAWITGVKFSLSDNNMRPIRLKRIVDKDSPNVRADGFHKVGLFQIKDTESLIGLLRLSELTGATRTLPLALRRRPEANNRIEESKRKQTENELSDSIKDVRFLDYGLIPSRPDYTSLSNEKGELLPSASVFLGPWNPLDAFRQEFSNELSLVSYLGPLRSPPARHYLVSGSDRATVGSRGERMPQLLYRRRRDILPIINDKLSQFGIPYTMDVQNVGNSLTGDIIAISLSDQNGIIVSPSDVGFGIGQLLPILVEGLVSRGRTICVEQPEIHLHPRLQAHVADFLIETAKLHGGAARAAARLTGSRDYGGNQWIVETHSEAIILRMQTLIKKKEIPPAFLSVLYIQPTDIRGARVLRLRLDEEGDFIDEWPDGFFEERFEEIFRKRH